MADSEGDQLRAREAHNLMKDLTLLVDLFPGQWRKLFIDPKTGQYWMTTEGAWDELVVTRVSKDYVVKEYGDIETPVR